MMAVGDYEPEKPQPQIFFHRKANFLIQNMLGNQ